MNGLIKSYEVGRLKVRIFEDRETMGIAAAADYAAGIARQSVLTDNIRMIFAAAPSQNEFLRSLRENDQIDWGKVTAFHMDEYIGLSDGDDRLFYNFLNKAIFSHVGFKAVHGIFPGDDPEELCKSYTEILNAGPMHLVALGIGENGHLAFNDPPLARFDEPEIVKIVKLDETCRQQQVNDGAFHSIQEVPTRAISLSIPYLMGGEALYCMVPGKTKTEAVRRTLKGEISEDCPASILRTHSNATLYLDVDSAAGVI